MKQDITEYLDYRDFLLDFYTEKRKRNSYFSYRYIASKVGVDASHIAKIFSKKRHIPERAIIAFVEFCGLNKRDEECFRLLIKFSKAKADDEAKKIYEDILSFQDVSASKLGKNQYEYYNKWYYTAILILLDTIIFTGDYKWLANELTPSISVPDAKNAIKLLLNLELIEKDKDGVYRPTDRFVTTGDTVRQIAIKNYQEEVIRMASESLRRHKKEERDISTVTISIDKKDMPTISEVIKDFRQTLLRFSDETRDPNSVYQLNVQMYPMTKGGKL